MKKPRVAPTGLVIYPSRFPALARWANFSPPLTGLITGLRDFSDAQTQKGAFIRMQFSKFLK
jgi:hypothetical protein